jgi:hypothetical protein
VTACAPLDENLDAHEKKGITMPISAAKLMALYPPTEDDQKQLVDLAQVAAECLSRQLAEVSNAAASALLSATKVDFETPYFPPPLPVLPPVQEQRIHIVIDLILDLPLER